ncbi:MAG: TIGR01244 family sulfur transferase [Azospirillaceae bacterium]
MKITTVTDSFAVSPQIRPEDVPRLAADGYTTVINNRPDGEAPDQPPGAAIAKACDEAGLSYVDLPFAHTDFQPELVRGMRAAIDAADGKVFAFCRSGTRSYTLWALATVKSEADLAAKIERAAEQGFDINASRVLARLM